jgi:REase_AHJR-like
MQGTTPLERQRVRALVEEYRSKGYEVIEMPSPEQLPDFLTGYRPDLLIRKGDETIVVEVKSRASLGKDPQIRELARLLSSKPNWNFELVVVREEEQLSAPEGTRPFDREDILRGNEDSPQQAAGYPREMHPDEKPRFLKLFPLSGNSIASYGESVRLKRLKGFLSRALPRQLWCSHGQRQRPP